MLLASPVLVAVLGMGALDRTAQTTFFIPSRGGSQYLYENLFWVFGHPEVYILALPGFGIVLELTAGVRTQAALGLPARRLRHGRRRAPLVARLAAPPVRERDQQRLAAVLHVLDGADLRSDRVHVPLRADDALARADQARRADALLPRVVLQLPDRRALGDLPLGRAERHDARTAASSRWRTSTTRSWAGSCSRSSPRSTSGCRR